MTRDPIEFADDPRSDDPDDEERAWQEFLLEEVAIARRARLELERLGHKPRREWWDKDCAEDDLNSKNGGW
jgi:hypothetical protein